MFKDFDFDRWFIGGGAHLCLILAVVFWIGCASYIRTKTIQSQTLSKIESLEEIDEMQKIAKENRYKCYFDGEEVNITKFALSQYNCVIDEKNETVYLTRR